MIRVLTEGERRLARQAFGGSLSLDKVRICSAPWPFNRAFVPGRAFGRTWIVWPGRSLTDDLSVAPLSLQATLVHELTHVWQADAGVNLLLAKLKAGDGNEAYHYPADTEDWAGLNIEQQAMAVEDRFRLSRGAATRCDAAFYDRICPQGDTAG